MTQSVPYSDHELLIALHSGDKKAFDALYFRYFGLLSNYAFRKLQDESLVEELVQDVFIDIWRMREKLNTEGNLEGLLFAMTRNKTLHQMRARLIKMRHAEKFNLLHKNDVTDEVTDELYIQQIEEKILQVVNQLSPQCRTAFTLSRYEHLSHKEIAEKMCISVNTVEKHIGKALHLLREELQGYLFIIIELALLGYELSAMSYEV